MNDAEQCLAAANRLRARANQAGPLSLRANMLMLAEQLEGLAVRRTQPVNVDVSHAFHDGTSVQDGEAGADRTAVAGALAMIEQALLSADWLLSDGNAASR